MLITPPHREYSRRFLSNYRRAVLHAATSAVCGATRGTKYECPLSRQWYV